MSPVSKPALATSGAGVAVAAAGSHESVEVQTMALVSHAYAVAGLKVAAYWSEKQGVASGMTVEISIRPSWQ